MRVGAKRTAVVSILLATGLVLAACGGDEPTTGQGSATPQATGAAPVPGAPQSLLDQQRLTVLDQPLDFPRKAGRVPSVTSRIITLEPGQQTQRQEYRSTTYIYVLEGTYTVEYSAGVSRDFPAGTAYLEAVDTTLTGRNNGADPARIMIVQFGSAKR